MNLHDLLRLALDPAHLLTAAGLAADPWQRDLLASRARQLLLCCSRQAGKSTAVAALALHTVLFQPGALVLLLSPTQRQSAEIFRKVLAGFDAIGRPLSSRRRSQCCLELTNGARVLSLPGREESIRSFSGVTLLIIDEAARVRDDLYRSVRPMLAVSQGRLVALSTPFGQRGWFHQEWVGSGPWQRFQVTWRDCPRITPEFIAEELRALGPAWVAQEYETVFTSLEGLVYPDFATCTRDEVPTHLAGRLVGGIDFGWRNPFAAVWGTLDADDVLWLTGERYRAQTPLPAHAAALAAVPGTLWYADPAGAAEIASLRTAGLVVRPADNDIRAGIAAVSSRLQSGRLRVVRRACPHLLHEASLYRYPTAAERLRAGENPVDECNHALAALRYLVAGLDAGFLARQRRRPTTPRSSTPALAEDSLWTPWS
ncbi:MAG: terminase family protein [Gemmataceae bacterium]